LSRGSFEGYESAKKSKGKESQQRRRQGVKQNQGLKLNLQKKNYLKPLGVKAFLPSHPPKSSLPPNRSKKDVDHSKLPATSVSLDSSKKRTQTQPTHQTSFLPTNSSSLPPAMNSSKEKT